MPIYEKPTKILMAEWAAEHLIPGKSFAKDEPISWFAHHYPDIKPNTISMHVESMSVNNRVRQHHPSVKPGSGHDLFWKVGSGQFRLWDPDSDAAALYKSDIEAQEIDLAAEEETRSNNAEAADATFAYEKDLQSYLARNLSTLEAGLSLFEEDGLKGIEYDAGGRYIDILAIDRDGDFVVIELKVSRGYDRVIGQILRYIGWVEQNLANGRKVRGIIVANSITNDLVLATRSLPVKLFEYQLSFTVQPVATEN